MLARTSGSARAVQSKDQTSMGALVLITPEYPPHNIGGGGVVFEALARGLAEHFARVTVFTGDFTGESGVRVDGNIEVHRTPLFTAPRSMPYLRGYLPPKTMSIYSSIVRAACDADVVHVHGCGSPFCDLAARFLSRARVPYFLTNHGYPRMPNRVLLFRRAFQAYERALVRPAVMEARRVSSVSEFCSADGPLSLRDVDVIPNGIGESLLSGRRESGRPDDVLMFAGRLQIDKGLAILLRAMARSGDRWLLRVAGEDGGYLRNARGLAAALGIARRVSFLGRLSREAMIAELSGAYALVLPSLNEPFGLVGLEAMAVGTLLISSDSGGMRTYADSRNAKLFATGNADSLAAVLCNLPLAAEEYSLITRAAYETARSFGWPHIIRKYRHWYSTRGESERLPGTC